MSRKRPTRGPRGARPAWPQGRSPLTAAAPVAAVLGGVYLATLLPGVGGGDTGELQYMSAVLGICHSPGYAIEVVAGKLFSWLPLGGDIAWRINLMMAVCGVAGALAVLGAVRLATGSVLAGALAALILGFSSMYWQYSVVAEAYVFHTAFLLLGVYAAARFVRSDSGRWLFIAALAVGVCIAGRPSEIFALPGFAGLWLAFRRQITLDWRRLGTGATLLVAPFFFSMGYYLVRADPSLLHVRDMVLLRQINPREKMAALEYAEPPSLSKALSYSLGLYWAEKDLTRTTAAQIDVGLRRYARMLSGAAIVAGDAPPKIPVQRDAGFGTSIALSGLLLAALGVIFQIPAWDRGQPGRSSRWGWALLGLGLFAGNLAFYLWHYRWDGLTFTVPGLAGLALLAGLGIAGPPGAGARLRGALAALGVVTAALLLAGNYRLVDQSAPSPTVPPPQIASHIPQGSMLLMSYWPSTTYRYVLQVQAGRTDLHFLIDDPSEWSKIAERLRNDERDLFVLGGRPTAQTPPPLARYGLSLVHRGQR